MIKQTWMGVNRAVYARKQNPTFTTDYIIIRKGDNLAVYEGLRANRKMRMSSVIAVLTADSREEALLIGENVLGKKV